MGQFVDLPTNPTNADLGAGVRQVHDCLEEFKKQSTLENQNLRKGQLQTAERLGEIRTEIGEEVTSVKDEVTGVKEEIEHIAGQVILLNKRLGIIDDSHEEQPRRKNSLLFMSQGEAVWKGGLSVTALIFFWKLVNDVWPFLVKLFTEVNSFIIHYH